jgi:NAD(P)-dependent dehydrogenase (short-subunit alcohol dehydrogenase family)
LLIMSDRDAEFRAMFNLDGHIAVITGGAGLLGRQHAEIIAAAGGIPVLVDLRGRDAEQAAHAVGKRHGVDAMGIACDITDEGAVGQLRDLILDRFGRVDILLNNAANNPKVENGASSWSRLESFPVSVWRDDLSVGLTGAFLCSRCLGAEMAQRGKGVIVNVASDLAVIAPDQRLYREPGRAANDQPTKPVTYSVVKTGLIGLTRYLATYWADAGVRVNAISPGGIYNNQPAEFVDRLSSLIPMGRMARADEYRGAILFLCSDASSYMTGQNLIVDGGRTVW